MIIHEYITSIHLYIVLIPGPFLTKPYSVAEVLYGNKKSEIYVHVLLFSQINDDHDYTSQVHCLYYHYNNTL